MEVIFINIIINKFYNSIMYYFKSHCETEGYSNMYVCIYRQICMSRLE